MAKKATYEAKEAKSQSKPVSVGETAQTVPLEHRRSADFRIYYANGVQISPTQWDVQFVFEQIIAPPMGAQFTNIVAEQTVGIVMSLDHARSFFEVFERQMKKKLEQTKAQE